MECSECRDLVIGYSSGDLPASRRELFEVHVRSCEDCGLYVSQYDGVWKLLDEWREVEPRSDFVSNFWERVSKEEKELNWGFLPGLRKLGSWSLAGVLASVLIVGMFTFLLFRSGSGLDSYVENDARDEIILHELDNATTRDTSDALSIYGPWENNFEIMKINGYGDTN